MFWIGERPPAANSTNPAFADLWTLNASGHMVAFVFRVPKTGTLNRFGTRLGTVGNNPDNGLRFSFQDPSTVTGAPDETQDQYADVTGALSSNTWCEPSTFMGASGAGSGAQRSVTAGDWLACVIEFVSFVAGDSVSWAPVVNNAQPTTHDAFTNVKNTGSWAMSTNGRPNTLGLLYDGDTDYTPIAPDHWGPFVTFTAETAHNTGTTPDERGLAFQMPFDCEVDGASLWCDIDNAADFVLYDSDGATPLATISLTSGTRLSTNAGDHRVSFAPVALTAGLTYRLSLKPTSASDVQLYTFTVPSNAHMGAVEGGATWIYTERTDAGAWSETNTKRPWAALHVASLTVVGGSPSGSTPNPTSYAYLG